MATVSTEEAGGASSRGGRRRLLRRRRGPAGAAVRRDAGRARRPCHRQADRARPLPAHPADPRARPRQVQGLARAHISAGGALRDVLLQLADGPQLAKAPRRLCLRRQDPLPPRPARCVLRRCDGVSDGCSGRRGVDRAQGQLPHAVEQDLQRLRQVLPPHRQLRLLALIASIILVLLAILNAYSLYRRTH